MGFFVENMTKEKQFQTGTTCHKERLKTQKLGNQKIYMARFAHQGCSKVPSFGGMCPCGCVYGFASHNPSNKTAGNTLESPCF